MAANTRKRQRSELQIEASSSSFGFCHSNCLRILCLLALSQVVLPAYLNQNVHKTSRSSSSLQFSGAASVHSTSASSRSALHISFAETSDSASAAELTTPLHKQHAAIESGVLPEWELLSEPVQQELGKILAYEKISTYDYPSLFRLDELTDGHPLLFMSWAILASPYSQPVLGSSVKSLNLLKDLNLSPQKFYCFIRSVEEGYQNNPFHNRVHAADVLQTLHALLTSQVSLELTPIEHFSILLAAVLHDVGHDGTNNPLHIQKQSPLAIQFQNQSVLERYHIQIGLGLLSSSGLLEEFSTEQQLQVSQLVTDAILHTDMSKHHAQVEAYRQGKLDPWEQAMYLLHLCDISNPTKSTALLWTDKVVEEFFHIGDEQRKLGLPVAPTCDRHGTDTATIQQGFIKYMVLPAFEAVDFASPKIMQNLHANLEYWMNYQSEETKESA